MDDTPKTKKPKPLKINGSLKNEIIKLQNADKKFHESWNKGRNICDFPHPYRLVILGQTGRGKSTLGQNIFLRTQAGQHPFQELIIIHGSKDSKEYDELEPTLILNDIPHPDDLSSNNKKSLIMIDDFEFTKLSKDSLKNLSSLFRFISTHHNFSIILCYQSFFEIPTIIKKCANIYVIYKPTDTDELVTIGRRVGLKKEVITKLFKEILNEDRDTLCCDFTEHTPSKYRKNLFIPIEIEEDDDK